MSRASSRFRRAIAQVFVDQGSFQMTLILAFRQLLVILMSSPFSFAFDSSFCVGVDNALIKEEIVNTWWISAQV
jgi:phosphomevalonate kinase